MGYATDYTLTLDIANETTTNVVGFLEYANLKDRPFSAIRKKFPDAAKYLEEMEQLEGRYAELVHKHQKSGYLMDAAAKHQLIADAWAEQLDACRWYEHADDMKLFSTLFPEVLFTLEGRGEESGDLWVKYFQNGKMQEARAQISYEPFDPKKLE